MNPKQKRFCELLAKMGYDPDIDSQGAAYMAAGYKCKNLETASACASRLLTDASVRAYYESLMEAVESKRIASISEVQEFFTKAMRGEIEEEVVIATDLGIKKDKKQIVPRDRITAGQHMAKIQGLYAGKGEDNVSVQVVFVDDIPEE